MGACLPGVQPWFRTVERSRTVSFRAVSSSVRAAATLSSASAARLLAADDNERLRARRRRSGASIGGDARRDPRKAAPRPASCANRLPLPAEAASRDSLRSVPGRAQGGVPGANSLRAGLGCAGNTWLVSSGILLQHAGDAPAALHCVVLLAACWAARRASRSVRLQNRAPSSTRGTVGGRRAGAGSSDTIVEVEVALDPLQEFEVVERLGLHQLVYLGMRGRLSCCGTCQGGSIFEGGTS